MTDHGDGPAAKDNPDADIIDFFAFPLMEGEERQLVRILNVFPAATSSARFSDEADDTFRVHRISAINGSRSKPKGAYEQRGIPHPLPGHAGARKRSRAVHDLPGAESVCGGCAARGRDRDYGSVK
jgi:hypothetical protein